MPLAEKEQRIKTLFLAHGIKVRFTGSRKKAEALWEKLS